MTGETIRPATASDIPELQRLFTDIFNVTRAETVWRWKYFEHPLGSRSMVVDAGDRLVAHCGGTAVLMRDGSERYEAMQSVDFMSSRRYAGGAGRGGVFVRMVDAFFREYCGPSGTRLLYGFPGERHRLLGERVLGYAPVERVGEFSANPVSAAEPFFEPLDEAALRSFTSAGGGMGAERSFEYLAWRYLHHPVHSYGIVSARAWPWRTAARCLVRVDSEGRLLVTEWGGNTRGRAFRRLASRLRQMGRFVQGWTSERHPIARELSGTGWDVRGRDHFLEVRSFSGRAVPRPGEMYYSLGDYDVD